MSETFISKEDNWAKCSLCDASKRWIIGKNGKRYMKYDILVMEHDHKHKWIKVL